MKEVDLPSSICPMRWLVDACIWKHYLKNYCDWRLVGGILFTNLTDCVIYGQYNKKVSFLFKSHSINKNTNYIMERCLTSLDLFLLVWLIKAPVSALHFIVGLIWWSVHHCEHYKCAWPMQKRLMKELHMISWGGEFLTRGNQIYGWMWAILRSSVFVRWDNLLMWVFGNMTIAF